ncbi:MAG: F0F1 ATP synthase subunit B [Chromatiales bacterium]|nr:F0F1 ATP synthase subunit B [Chromatiales bacterium]
MNVTLTLIGQMGTFAVLIWFVMKFLWTPMLQVMEDRQNRISDGLAAAERGKEQQEEAEKAAAEQLSKAREQAKEIIAQANRRADEIVEEAKGEGRQEGERMIGLASAEIDQQRNQAREELRGEVVKLALAGASQVLEREVDANAHNSALEKIAAGL